MGVASLVNKTEFREEKYYKKDSMSMKDRDYTIARSLSFIIEQNDLLNYGVREYRWRFVVPGLFSKIKKDGATDIALHLF